MRYKIGSKRENKDLKLRTAGKRLAMLAGFVQQPASFLALCTQRSFSCCVHVRCT
jgi:hypothetical protein